MPFLLTFGRLSPLQSWGGSISYWYRYYFTERFSNLLPISQNLNALEEDMEIKEEMYFVQTDLCIKFKNVKVVEIRIAHR